VAEYDPGYELVIDPYLKYSTHLGGGDHDYGYALLPDGAGGVWVAGMTSSANFPVMPGAYQDEKRGSTSSQSDTFISRFSSAGELLSSTYLGGSGDDRGRAIATDDAGGVWVTGGTSSTNFPVTNGSYQGNHGGGTWDCFVSRFSFEGDLLYSTYLGAGAFGYGTWLGDDYGRALAPDGSGGVWVAGDANTYYFPVTHGAYQTNPIFRSAFVSRFSSTGDLVYSTFLGGNAGWDFGRALAPDGSGGVWITGSTESTDFPVTDDAYQGSHPGGTAAFVSRVSSVGGLVYSTFLGGTGEDSGYGLAPDDAGGVWVTGSTGSTDFPVAPDAHQESYGGGLSDVFVTRFSSGGTLLHSTYLGGNVSHDAREEGHALVPDGSGGVWVTGWTQSTDFPVTDDVQQDSHGGGLSDVFVTRFSSGGTLLYSTYLGGSGDDRGWALASEGSGGVWVAGETRSGNFPVTDDAYQGVHAGGRDAFVTFFSVRALRPVAGFTATPTHGHAPLPVQFTDFSTRDPAAWVWEYSTGGNWTRFSTSQHPFYQFTSAGTYSIRLTVMNVAGEDTETKVSYITVGPAQPAALSVPVTVTAGVSERLLAFGADPDGTDGFDTGLDIAAPPTPPDAAFDTVFMTPDPLFPRLYTDIRGEIDEAYTERTWQMAIISQEADAVISWDSELLPEDLACMLTHAGTEYDMKSVGNITIPRAEDGTVQTVEITLSLWMEMQIPLVAGWNLVSVPYADAEYTLPTINPIQVVYWYNPATRSYVTTSLDQMQPGQAYWVASTNATGITVAGTGASPITSDLTAGWNLIGGKHLNVPFTSIAISPTNAWAMPFAYGYNTGTRAYETAATLQPGHGYWGAVTADCTITIPGE
jgi:PKD repeat protein